MLTCPIAKRVTSPGVSLGAREWGPLDLLPEHKSPLPSLELHGREIRVGAGGKHVVDGGAVGLRGQEAAFRLFGRDTATETYVPHAASTRLSSCQRVGRRLCERPESAGPRVSWENWILRLQERGSASLMGELDFEIAK